TSPSARTPAPHPARPAALPSPESTCRSRSVPPPCLWPSGREIPPHGVGLLRRPFLAVNPSPVPSPKRRGVPESSGPYALAGGHATTYAPMDRGPLSASGRGLGGGVNNRGVGGRG